MVSGAAVRCSEGKETAPASSRPSGGLDDSALTANVGHVPTAFTTGSHGRPHEVHVAAVFEPDSSREKMCPQPGRGQRTRVLIGAAPCKWIGARNLAICRFDENN